MNRYVLYGFAAATLLAACGGTSDKVDFTLSALTFQEGHSEPLVIKAEQNGKTVDVTDQATFLVTGSAVTIDDKHVLHAVMPGTSTINVKYQALSGSSTVTVTETKLQSLEVQLAPGANFKVGETAQLVVLGTHEGGNQRPVTSGVTFDVNDPRVATVDNATEVATVLAGGPVQITAHVGDLVSAPLATKGTCDYPHAPGNFSARPIEGRVMPHLVFSHARYGTGSQELLHDFDLNDVYCNADWKDTKVLIMYVGAGWCYPCTLFAQSLADQADDLKAAGAQIIMVEAQKDDELHPVVSDWSYGWQHISDISQGHGHGVPAGLVTGDSEIESPAGQACNSPVQGSNCYFNNQQAYLTQFPSVFVVRTKDMKIIADQVTTYLPLLDIANNPDGDWSSNGGTFNDNCQAADNTAHEPDDHPSDVNSTTAVSVGTPITAGICKDNDTDIYSVNVSGDWTAKIDFINAVGNLDLYLWDPAKNQPLEVNGDIIASTTNDDHETIKYHGPGTIAVQGFSHASADYTLTVTSP